MITFLTLNIEGYCSIGESIHLPLNTGGTVLIKAPNGSGKSSIFSALVWGLYGKNIRLRQLEGTQAVPFNPSQWRNTCSPRV